MLPRFDPDLIASNRTELSAMSHEELEDLAWRQGEALRSLANRLREDSTTSSRPPSSDDPYRREARGEPKGGDEPSCERDQISAGEIVRTALALAKLYQSAGRALEAREVTCPALEGFSPTPESARKQCRKSCSH